jgi:hypothetical protein
MAKRHKDVATAGTEAAREDRTSKTHQCAHVVAGCQPAQYSSDDLLGVVRTEPFGTAIQSKAALEPKHAILLRLVSGSVGWFAEVPLRATERRTSPINVVKRHDRRTGNQSSAEFDGLMSPRSASRPCVAHGILSGGARRARLSVGNGRVLPLGHADAPPGSPCVPGQADRSCA